MQAVDLDRKLTKRFTQDNKLLKNEFKPIQFMNQFFNTNPFIQQTEVKLPKRVRIVNVDKVCLYRSSRPVFKLNMAEVKERPNTDLFLRDLSTERSTRFQDVLQNTFYKSVMKPKSLSHRDNHRKSVALLNKEQSQVQSIDLHLSKQTSDKIQFEDIDLSVHLASLRKYQMKNKSLPKVQIVEDLNDSGTTQKQVQVTKEFNQKRPRWLSEKLHQLDKKFSSYIKSKQSEWNPKPLLPEQDNASTFRQDRSPIDLMKNKFAFHNHNKRQSVPLYQFYLSCIFADSIFQKRYTTAYIMKQFVLQTMQKDPSNKVHNLDQIEADELFLDIISNISLLNKIIQSKKVVVVVLMKIPGFNQQIKTLLFKIKQSKSLFDPKEEVLLKENLSPEMLMVQFIIGFENTVPQFQVDAMEEMILQGSDLNQLLFLPQRALSTKKSKNDTKSIIEQVMMIAQNKDTMVSYVKDLNLDLDFIKKLYYYNKNLEEYVESMLHKSAVMKNEEIERRKLKVNDGIMTYLHGPKDTREKDPSEKKKLIITNLLNEYKFGQKSQVLYHSHILSQLQHAETNSGSYSRVKMGSRLVFHNINEQAAGYRQ